MKKFLTRPTTSRYGSSQVDRAAAAANELAPSEHASEIHLAPSGTPEPEEVAVPWPVSSPSDQQPHHIAQPAVFPTEQRSKL